MRIGVTSPQTFLALLVRRKWLVVVPFVALSVVIAILIYFLPKAYLSETLILVQPRDVPKDFVKDLISGSTEERLNAIEQTVLSRTNLLQILREFDSSLPEFRGLNLDEKVLKLRGQIGIAFEDQKKSGNGVQLPLTYFRISYRNQNPELAQKIASKLTALFIEKDNKTREDQVFGTTAFLSSELAKVAAQLNESEAKLKEVKSLRQFEMPAQLPSNLKTLDRLVEEKKTTAEAIDREATTQFNLENQLAATPEFLPRPVAAPRPPAPVDPLLAEYRKTELEYKELAAKYSAIHPEVRAAKAHMDRLREQIPSEALAVPDGKEVVQPSNDATLPNPAYLSLAGQLRTVKTEAQIREKTKAFIDSEIAKYSQRVEETPKTELDMADAVRQNTDLQKQYDDLKGKLSQAQLSESLESKQKGAQFIIVDPANYPLTPTKPNKPLALLAGTVLSLLVGIAFAAAVDVARQRVWTQSEIEAFWGVPVLVDIPEIVTDSDLALLRKKKNSFMVSSAAAAVAYSFCLYLIYLEHGFILQTLDPVLQKTVYK